MRRLEYIDLAQTLNDLLVPLGNRLHSLKGNRQGQPSISINDQWRICFRFVNGPPTTWRSQIIIKERL